MRKRDERGGNKGEKATREWRGRRNKNKVDIWRGRIGKVGRKRRGMKSNRKPKQTWKLRVAAKRNGGGNHPD